MQSCVGMDRLSIAKADLTMRDVMTSASRIVASQLPLDRACAILQSVRAEELPVVDNGWPVGILSARHAAAGGAAATVADAMDANVYVTDVDANLLGALRAIVGGSYDAALVYDGTRLVGLFTARDALRALAEVLPEDRLVRKAA